MEQQIQQNMTPGPYKQFQQNQSVINPIDGKLYNVVQQNPGKGVTLQDPTTNQQFMVSEEDSQNLKPAIKTSAFEERLNELLNIEKEFNIENTHISEKSSKDISINKIAQEIVTELTGQPLPFSGIQVTSNKMKKAHMMNSNWHKIRKEYLKTKSQMTQKEISELPTYNEPRQDSAVRELIKSGFLKESKIFSPYKGDLIKEVGRDKKTGLPMRGGDEKDIGLTEFPYGVDKNTSPEGYGAMSMEDMDRKFEEDRPHFKNEQLLPDYTKKREESITYLNRRDRERKIKDLRKDFNTPRYSLTDNELDDKEVISSILNNELGIEKKGISLEEDISNPKELPIQYKETQKAPKLEEFNEPLSLEQAPPDVKAAISLLRETQSKINDIQDKIEEKTEPLKKAILDATKDLNEELSKNAALLKSTLDILYQELDKTKDKVVVLDDEIFAVISREKAVAPSATLAQILKKAKEINPQILEEINKIKALIENENTEYVIERFLYKYPVSEVQKKKLQSSLDTDKEGFDEYVQEIVHAIESLQYLNETLLKQ